MTVVSNAVEHEVVLAMDLGADLPDLREAVTASVRQPEEHLCTVYFDTADRRLWNMGITLGHRTGEGTPRWTLKLPHASGDSALKRTELDWPGEIEQIPQAARDVVSGIVRREPLHKIAELHSERVRFLFGMEAVPWAELTNDVVTVLGGQADGRRFRQIKLEILSNGADRDRDAKAILKALRKAGARSDPHPQLEKVLGPPERPPELGRRSSVEDLVRQAVSAGLVRLLDHEYRIRASGGDVDPEDVHQARVATRRLRSDLGTLKPLIDPVWVGHVRDDLKWIAGVLGAVRDIDVLAQNLADAGAGDRLVMTLSDERSPAVETLQKSLTESRYMDLVDRLHAASVRPPLPDRGLAHRRARKVLPGLVKRRWKKLRRDVRKGGRRPGDDHLHQVRKDSKQLRYASELATPVVGKAASRTAKAAESLQTILGQHHDAVVAREWLLRVGGAGPAFDVSSLIEQEDRRRERLGRKWRSHYKKLAKRRNWL